MVLRRGDARHKNVPDPLEAGPKRITTIHAQRKFAQGAGMNSPAMSPIKEKEKSKVNGAPAEPSPSTSAIPAKRPRTEDFITFLCYRGTSVLPPALNSFNVASKPEKNDRETGSPAGSSKQAASPSRQEKEDKLKRAKQNKHMVMQSKSKVLDQRQRKTRINAIAVQKAGKVMKNRKVNPPISKERLKKAAGAVVNASHKQLKVRPAVPVRASHPSILKRISASRARAGLRSGGQLPPGSDAGIKTDRKPRDQALLRGKLLVSNVKRKALTPVRMKVKRVSKPSSVTPISQKLKRGQPLSKATLRKASPPKSLNVASRPSRKTKEAATLYMEMITKDLRSPEDEEEEDIAESPLKSEDVEMDAATVRTRTRSANVESTPDVSPVRGSKKKPMKKNSVTTQSPSPSTIRRSLKRIPGLSSNAKPLPKKTRASNKEETPNGEPVDDESIALLQGRASRRSAVSGKNNQASTSTSAKSKRLVGISAKKVTTPKQNNSGKIDGEVHGKSEDSSQSEEEDESSSSHPSPKKLRKVSDGFKSDKALSSGGKKSAMLKKNVQDLSKKDSKKSVKETEEGDTGQDKARKRSTRSAGGDSSVKGVGKDISGDVGKKGQGRTKIKTQNTKKIRSSESEASDVEVTSKKVPNKDTVVGKRRSTKKEFESESGEELEEPSKNILKKPMRQARTSVKVQDNVPEMETEGEKPPNKRQSRSIRSRVNKTNEKESDEDDVEHSPSRKQPGRVKKANTVVKEVEKMVDLGDKRATRKSSLVDVRDKTKKTESKSIRTESHHSSDSDQVSESEEEKHVTLRRTRYSRPVDTPDSESEKRVEAQVKRTRHSSAHSLSQPQTENESENEVTSTKKLRRVAKPVASKFEVSDESDKEESMSRSKKSLRQATMKSEKLVDSGPELRRVSKPVASKSEVSDESDNEDSASRSKKSLRQTSVKSEKAVDSGHELRRVSKSVASKSEVSDESDKEDLVSKSKKSLRQASLKSEKAVDSGPELRRVSKPVASKSEVSDESDKEDSASRSKKSHRHASGKSEKAADSGPEEGVPKQLNKLRHSSKIESGGESDKDVHPKRQRQNAKAKFSVPEQVDIESDRPEKEPGKPLKSGNKKSLKSTEDDSFEEDNKKVGTARSNRGTVKAPSDFLKNENMESEIVTKRSSRFSHQSSVSGITGEMKIATAEIVSQNYKELAASKSNTADLDSRKDFNPKQTRNSNKNLPDDARDIEVPGTTDKDCPPKKVGRPPKTAIKDKTDHDNLSKEKKEVSTRQPRLIAKHSEEDQSTSLIDINKKNAVTGNDGQDVKTTEAKDNNKKPESSQPKKPTKKADIKAESKSTLDKEVTAPAKRGRKPKKVEEVVLSEVEKVSEENETRPRTKRKAAAKSRKSIKESYSEFSEEEEVDISLPRTRERKSNIRYTEKDTDDESEAEVVSEEEVEKRPRRSRRSVFPTSLALDLDSDEEFVQPPTRTTRKKFRKSEKEEKSDTDDSEVEKAEAEDPVNEKDLNAATVASKKVVEKTKSQNDKKPAAAKDKLLSTPQQSSVVNKALGKVMNEDGNLSDSSLKKSRTSTRNSLDSREFVESKKVVDEAVEKPLVSQASPASFLKSSEACTSLGKEISSNNSNDLSAAPAKLEDPSANIPDVLEKTNLFLSRRKEETLVNLTSTNVSLVESFPDTKLEPKRVSRRLSKDKPNLVDYIPLVQGKIDPKTPERLIPLLSSGKHENINQSSLPESPVPSTGFSLNPPNKGDYDALAILSDVAFSELQNRKNIMDRKLSSDSATSFSSDDVLLPVRKEKVLPKAKADLPTVREKTESDEEISDVGNEDTDDDSSYDEYRKTDKQPRRKRLPRRTRKEPVRQQSQRPVRSRRAKQTDSYVDDDYFTSDRSSSPETSPVKPVQKKRRKSEDKPTTLSTSPAATKAVVPTTLSPPINTTVTVPSAPSVSEIKILTEPVTPIVKPTKEVKPSVPHKEEAQKMQEIQRNFPTKTLANKPVIQAEPVLNVPRPQPSLPQTMPKVRVTLQSDVKNNNSVTLFSGVSGVTVTKTDRLSLIHSNPSPKEVPQTVHSFGGSTQVGMANPVKPPPYVPARSPAVSSSHSPLPKSNLFNMKSATDSSIGGSTENKPKPNIGDTWKNAFKNAKIPKAGQLSPAHHSSVGTPFTRKPFSSAPKPATKPDDAKPTAFVPTKLPSVQTFKPTSFPNFGKLGNQSPSRMPSGMSPSRPPIPGPPSDSKSNVYLSPSRVKNSPSKIDEKTETKKPESTPTKSLTLLQYEKRSQDLISSLKGSQPVLVDGIQGFTQAFPKLKEYSMEKAKSSPVKAAPPSQQPSAEDASKSEGGKHLNLPFAVEHAFRKRSPITVKKPVKPPVEKKAGPSITIPEMPVPVNVSIPRDRPSAAVPPPSTEPNRTTANLELLSKKKVQMTNEEIKKWLDDNTSSGVEHAKDCGIFENNQCECSYRTSGESMLNTSVGGVTEITIKKEDPKIDHGVVEPPVQLKELDSGAKFTAETISTCKVEDYKEKMLIKTPKPPTPEVKKELFPPGLPIPKTKKPMNLVVDKSKRKSSMTEDEMCEFDFRFERTSNSPRESCSDMSSPTPRDDVSSSNEEKFDPSSGLEKKSIFNQRRQVPTQVKRPPLSKSPCAFSAENESSVYAFEPDAPPPALSNPFRRRGSRHKSSEDDGPASSSIAVQVNLENVACGDNDQLECSTQTEQVENEGQLFYFPLEGDNNPQEVIQGVQVKLQSTEGPEQKVIMKAKLVTKPSLNIPSPPTSRPLGDAGRVPQRPEQKVRPLATTSTSTQSKPLGTVQPTIREPQPSCSASFTSQGTTTTSDRPDLANQSTQAAAVPQPLPCPPAQASSQQEAAKPAQPAAPISVPKPPVKSAPVTPAPRKSANEFPVPGTTARMVDAPTFYPTEKEFQDPLEYIEQITPQARSFGICRIVPPASFKPECKVTDDMRFTAYNQYVHKMLYRWGPNVREMTAIKKYLATQCIALKQPPLIGGMEIDLPRLYQTVQSCGGLKEVIEKKRWAKVADVMKIPKAAQDRVTKLDDIYCKFLLPYDTLSHSERSKLLEEVDAEWTERERRIALEAERESKGEKEEKEDNSESDEESDDGRDECMTKGKTMPLSQFYRVARNTMAMWFKEPSPSAKDVENEYWRLVTSRKQHVCVNSGSIDSGASGYGFPTSKSSSTSRHPWNLKVLTNNGGSILRSMGPIMGVTVPTLHVGMLFSACCWYRDPHGLPWIEYLHTGANKIWYAVPDLWNEELHGAMRTILPRYCQDKPIWLASDTAMVPPDLLVQQRVSLCRAVQEPGQFILVFPKAFTSTICTGYIVSESVYFAQPSWLNFASQIFKDIQESCEPPAFSVERLLFNMATDVRSSAEVLTQILPMIIELRDTELKHRKDLEDLGVTETERLAVSKGGRKRSQEEPQEYECEICRGNLYLSLVTNSVEEANFCLLHSVETLTKDRSHVKNCKLMYSYDEEEMDEVIEKIKQRIETKSCKKQNKTTSGSSKV